MFEGKRGLRIAIYVKGFSYTVNPQYRASFLAP